MLKIAQCVDLKGLFLSTLLATTKRIQPHGLDFSLQNKGLAVYISSMAPLEKKLDKSVMRDLATLLALSTHTISMSGKRRQGNKKETFTRGHEAVPAVNGLGRSRRDFAMSPKGIICYAEGSGESWEAFCVDFDLAVQGRSFQEVYGKLNEQISIYLEGVKALPEADRKRLLNRRIPLFERLRLLSKILWVVLTRSDNKQRHTYYERINGELAPA